MCKALDEIQRSAEQKGLTRGIHQGRQEGINSMNKLIQQLFAEGRQEDLVQAATDAMYRQKLFAEYHI